MEMMNLPPGVGGIQPQFQYQAPISGPTQYTRGFNIPNQQVQQQYNMQMAQQVQQQRVDPHAFDTPEIVVGPVDETRHTTFTVSDDPITIPVEDAIVVEEPQKRKRGRPPKSQTQQQSNTQIVRTVSGSQDTMSGNVESTSYTYMETTGLLKETLAQIDSLNSELAQEFQSVRNNKFMKNKYNTLIGLSENIGSLIGNRISAIREINSSISKANDLDYKKLKDMREAQAEVNDDAYVANLYQAFTSNPTNLPPQMQIPDVNMSQMGSGIIRADLRGQNPTEGGLIDASYLNYVSNMTPEQNLMRYENDPNVKQVVVFDASTGNKFFQMMNVTTGEVIPNVPVYDDMFMEDTTIDVNKRIAKNNNLHETFPLVVINENVTSQY